MVDAVASVEAQRARLDQLEETIRRGVAQFLAVGEALHAVRTERLYRVAGFRTWQVYCLEKWQISGRHANRLVAAFTWSQECEARGEAPPASEHSARAAIARSRAPAAAAAGESHEDGDIHPPPPAAAPAQQPRSAFGVDDARAIADKIREIRRLHSRVPGGCSQFDGILDLYLGELKIVMKRLRLAAPNTWMYGPA